jgi:predicted DNA-binding transcriptional regulator AlpA
MAQSTQDQLLTVSDVISAMGISRSTWQKLVAQKQTPPLCGSARYSGSDGTLSMHG